MKLYTIKVLTQSVIIAFTLASCNGGGTMESNSATQPISAKNKLESQTIIPLSNSIFKQNKDIIYINLKDYLASSTIKHEETLSSSIIQEQINNSNKKYIFDFSSIQDKSQLKQAKEFVSILIGTTFEENLLFVSKYKGKLMITPIENLNEQSLLKLNTELNQLAQLEDRTTKITSYSTRSATTNAEQKAASFYINVNKSIEDCKFPYAVDYSENGGSDLRDFCNNPHINLIYYVYYARSKADNAGGKLTPDSKIVRISIDNDTHGTGISLNDKPISSELHARDKIVLDAFVGTEYLSSALAHEYAFEVKASNGIANILRTNPSTNLNRNYTKTETSSFTFGFTQTLTGTLAEKPSAALAVGANQSWTDTRTLSYSTQDYAVAKTATPGGSGVKFSWKREQFPTASSLKDVNTSTVFKAKQPFDLSRVTPISYQNFIPNFDVIFSAGADAMGETEFTISSSVQYRPVYVSIYKHYYLIGGHYSYQGKEAEHLWKTTSVENKFKINWDSPVFFGQRAVKLQLGSFNNKCIAIDENNNYSVITKKCNDNDVAQGFFYDSKSRYVSALNSKKCLDAAEIGQLQECNSSQLQMFKWNGNRIISLYAPPMNPIAPIPVTKELAYDINTYNIGILSTINDKPLASGNLTGGFVSRFILDEPNQYEGYGSRKTLKDFTIDSKSSFQKENSLSINLIKLSPRDFTVASVNTQYLPSWDNGKTILLATNYLGLSSSAIYVVKPNQGTTTLAIPYYSEGKWKSYLIQNSVNTNENNIYLVHATMNDPSQFHPSKLSLGTANPLADWIDPFINWNVLNNLEINDTVGNSIIIGISRLDWNLQLN